jgi:hypothetical protein
VFDIRQAETQVEWLNEAGQNVLRDAVTAYDAGEVDGVMPESGITLELITGVSLYIDFEDSSKWPGKTSNEGYEIGKVLPVNPEPKKAKEPDEIAIEKVNKRVDNLEQP